MTSATKPDSAAAAIINLHVSQFASPTQRAPSTKTQARAAGTLTPQSYTFEGGVVSR